LANPFFRPGDAPVLPCGFDFKVTASFVIAFSENGRNCHFGLWTIFCRNFVIAGPPGIGKSHIAQALGHEATRRGLDVVA